MTEQEQAELLAAWLADVDAPIPDGLDPDVMETVIALHPERAPAPSVSIESILEGVKTGPFAANPMPHAVVAPPATDAPANRPWRAFALLAGGSSAMLAAALMLTVGVVVATQMQPSSREIAVQHDGVAAAPMRRDTGAAIPELPTAAKRPRPKLAARGRAKPAAAPDALPDAVADLGDGSAGDVYDSIDELDVEDDMDATLGLRAGTADGVSAPKGGAGPSLSKPSKLDDPSPADVGYGVGYATEDGTEKNQRAERQAQQAARRARDDEEARSYALEGAKSAMDRSQAEAEAARHAEENARNSLAREAEAPQEIPRSSRPRPRPAPAPAPAAAPLPPLTVQPSAPPPPPVLEEMKEELGFDDMRSAGGAMHEEQAEPPAEAKKAKERSKSKDKARKPRRNKGAPMTDSERVDASAGSKNGTYGVNDPTVDAARRALTTGDPATALNLVVVGLANHPQDTAIRQLLFALKGDAHAALGDLGAAEQSWSAARTIAARRATTIPEASDN